MKKRPANTKPTTEYKTFICKICGQEFERIMRSVRRAEKIGQEIKYCSRECATKGRDTRVEQICPVCGKTFLIQKRLANNKGERCCSSECAKIKHEEVHKLIHLTCKNCGKDFAVENSYYKKQTKRGQNITFCSKKCSTEYRSRNMITLTCINCGKEFLKNKNQISETGNTCSIKCLREWQKNQWHEVRCKNCGKIFKVNDYKFKHQKTFSCSMECKRDKLAKDRQTYAQISHYLRTHAKYDEWRFAIYKRDNHQCVKCGINDEHLHAHHIKPLIDIVNEYNGNIEDILNSDIFNDINNGITLCTKCHQKEHDFIQINEKGQFMPLYAKGTEDV